MARNEHLRHLVPAFWQYVGKSRVYFYGPRPNHDVIRADFESEEAAALAQLGFNQAIHEEVARATRRRVPTRGIRGQTRSVQLVFVLDRMQFVQYGGRGDSQVA